MLAIAAARHGVAGCERSRPLNLNVARTVVNKKGFIEIRIGDCSRSDEYHDCSNGRKFSNPRGETDTLHRKYKNGLNCSLRLFSYRSHNLSTFSVFLLALAYYQNDFAHTGCMYLLYDFVNSEFVFNLNKK